MNQGTFAGGAGTKGRPSRLLLAATVPDRSFSRGREVTGGTFIESFGGYLAQAIPPQRIDAGRFLMRRWEPADAPLFKKALDASLAELVPWIPWARYEPSDLDVLTERLARYRDEFQTGGDALYALMDPAETEVWGGAGLYRRVGPGAIEIGYWVRSDLTGRGLATRAASELTRVAQGLAGVERIEIHCDPRNRPSVAIPRKLGYRQSEIRVDSENWPGGAPRSLMVWELRTHGEPLHEDAEDE